MSLMSEYSPDSWVVLKIKPGKGMFPFYKVLAGWNGSYTEGSSWRLNSGITLVFDREDEIHFYGESGSVYRCGKETYGLTMSTAAIHQDLYLKQEFKGQIQIMEEDTDWTKLI